MRRILCVSSAALAAVVFQLAAVHAGQSPYGGSPGGEVVVQLAASADLMGIEKMYHLQLVDGIPGVPTYELSIGDGVSVSFELSRLRRNPDVRSAEPDYVFSAPEAASLSLTADPKCLTAHPSYIQQMYQEQWTAPAIGLEAAHGTSTGAGITVAVVDTGVQTDHPDLHGRLVPGYDFLNDDANVADPPGGTDSGHGTFVAGLIALAAPDARIVPIRVLDPSGQGDEIDVANGIYFAAKHGANIINLSLGSYLESKAVDAAVAYAQQLGVLVAAAAGNDNIGDPEYPATTSGVVGVAATNPFDMKASFSNYGNHITLSAPGTDLYSAYDNGQYAFGEGTSFATPLVAGVAALVWSAHPELSAEGVIEVLAADSASVDALTPDYQHELGAGRVDAERAVGDRLITAPPGPTPGPVPSENGAARVDPSPSVPAGTLTDFPAQSSPTATPTDDPSQLIPVPVRTDEPSAVSATAISTEDSPQTSPTPTPTDEPTQVDASATPDGASSETGVTAAPTGDPAQVNPTATPTDDSAQPGLTPVPEGNPSPSTPSPLS